MTAYCIVILNEVSVKPTRRVRFPVAKRGLTRSVLFEQDDIKPPILRTPVEERGEYPTRIPSLRKAENHHL